MGTRNDIFSFSGSGTDDIESIFYDCRFALMTVRHVCDAPDNHAPPEAALRGCAYILDGVLATLDSVEDLAKAKIGTATCSPPDELDGLVSVRRLREIEKRWGKDKMERVAQAIIDASEPIPTEPWHRQYREPSDAPDA